MTDSATAMPPLCFSTLCKISWKSDRRRDVTSHQERVEGPHQQWLGAVSTTQLSVNSSAIAREREASYQSRRQSVACQRELCLSVSGRRVSEPGSGKAPPPPTEGSKGTIVKSYVSADLE